MYNRKYDKILIQLKQDTLGYSLNERPASGSCSLEIKNNMGTLRIYIKDLKKSKIFNYKLYGICVKKSTSEGIPICDITPDKTGFFEYRCDFSPDNFMQFNKKIEDINVFSVICENSTETSQILSPLCGYTDMKINWKSKFKPIEQNDIIDINEYKEILENKENTISVAEKICCDNNKEYEDDILPELFSAKTSETFSNLTKKFREEMNLLESFGIFTKEDINRIMNGDSNTTAKNHKELTDFTTNPQCDVNNSKDIDLLFVDNKKVSLHNSDMDWIICDLNEAYLLPQLNISCIKNVFVEYSYKKYSHIIIGKNKNNYYIGIPDLYEETSLEQAKSIGFNDFIKKNNDGTNWGYWVKSI